MAVVVCINAMSNTHKQTNLWSVTEKTSHGNGKGDVESVAETARRAPSWIVVMEKATWKRYIVEGMGVMESSICGVSWKSCHGKCHGSREACTDMDKSHR